MVDQTEPETTPSTSFVDPPYLDRATVWRVLRRALGSETAEPVRWSVERLSYQVVWWGSDVYHVQGTAVDRGVEHPWHVVLKAVRRPTAGPTHGRRVPGDSPSSYAYWRREADLYRDGVLGRICGDLTTPTCLGVDEPDPDTALIWLEDVAEAVGHDWPLERHALAARHLGQFTGRYLVGEPVPDHPSCGEGYQIDAAAQQRRTAGGESEPCNLPAVRAVFPPAVLDRMRRAQAGWKILAAALERMPRVFCHRDAFRNNLIARRRPDGREQTVAVDWALAGPGPLGEDLYKAVINNLSFMRATVPAADFDAACFDGYLAGLRDAGWTGDARVARLGYAAHGLFHLPHGTLTHYLLDPVQHAAAARNMGEPLDALLHGRIAASYLAIDLAEEAIDLADRVG